MRGATTAIDSDTQFINNFNPRSPCGERLNRSNDIFDSRYISTHAPRAGSDVLPYASVKPRRIFQPTLPVRGATVVTNQLNSSFLFQPTLPVRGATYSVSSIPSLLPDFNPRSPCGERQKMIEEMEQLNKFQPTLPVRGATHHHPILIRPVINFNPRSPCGERLNAFDLRACLDQFQPTLPVRGATLRRKPYHQPI